MDKTDHTAEIFAALGVRIGTHPNWFKVTPPNETNLWEPMYKLTESCIESDGLAVRLVEIARDSGIKLGNPERFEFEVFKWRVSAHTRHRNTYFFNTSFATAVHDALCEALEITEEGKV